MAAFNEILAGRFNRALQKLLSMKGPPPAPSLAPEFMATLPFAIGPAELYLQGWESFGKYVLNANVAAIHSAVRFRNPAASGVIVVFESLVITNATGTDQNFLDLGAATAAGDLTSVQTAATRLDARGSASSPLVITNTAAGPDAAGIAAVDGVYLAANTPFQFIPHPDAGIPLLPGDALQVRNNVVNETLVVGARWRQRALEDSEVK